MLPVDSIPIRRNSTAGTSSKIHCGQLGFLIAPLRAQGVFASILCPKRVTAQSGFRVDLVRNVKPLNISRLNDLAQSYDPSLIISTTTLCAPIAASTAPSSNMLLTVWLGCFPVDPQFIQTSAISSLDRK